MKTPKEYTEQLQLLKDKFKGKRCFIVGNGPSLNKCDLSLLKDEYSFAVNGIFYKTKEMGYRPNFYMVEDNHVVYDNIKEINKYKCDYKFFPANYKNIIIPDENTIFIPADLGFYREYHPYFCKPRFSKDVSSEIFTGQSVTIMQLQMAYHLGFAEVYLIGMDFSYALPESTKVEGVNYTSQEDDPNHFHPDYFGKGKKWHDPKLDRVLMNYKKCKEEFEADDRKIYNATVGGKLEIFERRNYFSLFK
ncbi:MAG: 6-hydroxymethylpterin diphosphokinase MptE-like protein [bacterium]